MCLSMATTTTIKPSTSTMWTDHATKFDHQMPAGFHKRHRVPGYTWLPLKALRLLAETNTIQGDMACHYSTLTLHSVHILYTTSNTTILAVAVYYLLKRPCIEFGVLRIDSAIVVCIHSAIIQLLLTRRVSQNGYRRHSI